MTPAAIHILFMHVGAIIGVIYCLSCGKPEFAFLIVVIQCGLAAIYNELRVSK
jgi:hypothetical protein